MKKQINLAIVVLALVAGMHRVAAQGTAFTYQGRLNDSTNPANGSYDLKFTLFGVGSGGSVLAGPITNSATGATNGLFTAVLDFGSVFDGSDRWLEIAVRTNGSVGAYTVVLPRQQLTSSPYAIYALNAGNVSSVGAVQAQSLDIGQGNSANGSYTTIAGGSSNTVTGNFAVVAGGSKNMATSNSAAIGGGSANTASGDHGTVAGGESNIASGTHAFVGGGMGNVASSDEDVIVGGVSNSVSGDPAFIGAGSNNKVGLYAGAANQVTVAQFGLNSWIASGANNTVLANYAGIGGGLLNVIQTNSDYSFVGGGEFNSIQPFSPESTIGGGNDNSISSYASDSTIGGGINNVIYPFATHSVIGGGDSNHVETNANWGTIGGGYGNAIWSDDPLATNYFSTIPGGGGNNIYGGSHSSTIGGGQGNQIQKDCFDATIAGGESNYIMTNAGKSTIAGGYGNVILANTGSATIGGGLNCVAGGVTNDGSYSTVPGGYENQALGKFSFAAGDQAVARYPGTFVWADSTPDVNSSPWDATAPNQFLIRATNGVGINKNNPSFALDVNGTINATVMMRIQGTATGNANVAYLSFYDNAGTRTGAVGDGSASDGDLYLESYTGNVVLAGPSGSILTATPSGYVGIGTSSPVAPLDVVATQGYLRLLSTGSANGSVLELRNNSASPSYYGAINFVTSSGNVPGQIGYQSDDALHFRVGNSDDMMKLGTSGLYVNGTFVSSSDRNLKEHFQAVDPRQVLDKVAALPVTRWNYKQDSNSEHIGPMAQDFYAAFNVGPDDKHITTIDEGGVALAAIQGLNEKIDEKDVEIHDLKKTVDELKTLVQALAERK